METKTTTKENAGTPAIHANGSSSKSLIKEWEAFNDALALVRERFPFESFHPRNHYVKTGDGEGEAETVKAEMCEHLFALRKTAHQIHEGVLRQIED